MITVSKLDVELTGEILSKSISMMSQQQLKSKLENLSGRTIFQKGDENEYHMKLGNHKTGRHIIVFKIEDGKIIGVTQMQRHVNYAENSSWKSVPKNEIRDKVRKSSSDAIDGSED